MPTESPVHMFADVAPKPGDIVPVPPVSTLVEDVRPADGRDLTLVRVSCLEDDAQGVPLEVAWEAEVDTHPAKGDAWTWIAEHGSDNPRTFAAYLHVLRWNTVTSTNPKLFQTPYRAGIRGDQGRSLSARTYAPLPNRRRG